MVGLGSICNPPKGIVCSAAGQCADGKCKVLIKLGGWIGTSTKRGCAGPGLVHRGRCLARVSAGNKCGTKARAFCAPPSTCHRGVCQGQVAVGGKCDATTLCARGLRCVGKVCARTVRLGARCNLAGGTVCAGWGRQCANGRCKKVVKLGGCLFGGRLHVCAAPAVAFRGWCLKRVGAGEKCGRKAISFCAPSLTCRRGVCRGLHVARGGY